jgi:hypothetical protein
MWQLHINNNSRLQHVVGSNDTTGCFGWEYVLEKCHEMVTHISLSEFSCKKNLVAPAKPEEIQKEKVKFCKKFPSNKPSNYD